MGSFAAWVFSSPANSPKLHLGGGISITTRVSRASFFFGGASQIHAIGFFPWADGEVSDPRRNPCRAIDAIPAARWLKASGGQPPWFAKSFCVAPCGVGAPGSGSCFGNKWARGGVQRPLGSNKAKDGRVVLPAGQGRLVESEVRVCGLGTWGESWALGVSRCPLRREAKWCTSCCHLGESFS